MRWLKRITGIAIPVALGLLVAAAEQTARFELRGAIEPAAAASVTLHGATSPFAANTLADSRGRFRFRRLAAASYTVSVFVPGRGELRQTVVVGPSQADRRGRVEVTLTYDEARVAAESLKAAATVGLGDLKVSGQSRRLYEEAQKKLGRGEIEGAIADLERAVELSPSFTAAWNNLGTIAYQTGRFKDAESHFRRGLAADSEAWEPLVNLGGVLLNLNQPEEALHHNLHAVLRRPSDALAQSQLGLSYFLLGRLELAAKHLEEAIRLDAAHFSHPQLTLAEIHLRMDRPQKAAALFEAFLRLHPDDPRAGEARQRLEAIRSAGGAAGGP